MYCSSDTKARGMASPTAATPTEGGRKLRAHREALRESCPVFGARFDISGQRIGRYERGNRVPDIVTIKRFADAGICAMEDWTEPARQGLAHEQSD